MVWFINTSIQHFLCQVFDFEEHGTRYICALKLGTLQIRIPKIGILKIGITQIRALKSGALQIRAPQIKFK